MKLLREPLLHFLLIGAGLFGFFHLVSEQAGGPQIVVTAGEIEHLRATFARTWLRPPTAPELEGLVEDRVRDEVLSREAVALGLERGDTVIRRRLRQKMEFLAEESGESAPPSDAELRAFLAQRSERFRLEPRLAFRHVYVNPTRRGASAARDARAILERLTNGGATDPARLGDPLLLPAEFGLSYVSEIARQFGEPFAEQIQAIPLARWTGPVESGYGWHLVVIDERVEARVPELGEVREAVLREWQTVRQREAKEQLYQRLRARYRVVVERPRATEAASEAR